MSPYIILTIFVICPLILVTPKDVIRETKCKEFYVRDYEYSEFYDLSLIKDAQPAGFYAKLPITFKSEYGDIHVVFTESNDTTNTNRAYEFALGNYRHNLCEIRRKDTVHEKRNFYGNRLADYRIPIGWSKFHVELSISKDGVVQMRDLGDMANNFKFNFTDQLPVIPVKYVAFAGLRRSETKVIFDCIDIEVPHPTFLPISTVVTENTDDGTTDISLDIEATYETNVVDISPNTPTSTLSTITKPQDNDNETNEIAPESTTVVASRLL